MAPTGTGTRRFVWLVGIPVLLVLAAGKRGGEAPAVAWTKLRVPECPHSWDGVFDTLTAVALPGAVTNVPEFHDCQPFIVKGEDGLRYDSIFAIFSAWDLSRRVRGARDNPLIGPPLTVQPSDSNFVLGGPIPGVAGVPGPGTTAAASTGWAWAEIYAEGPYAPLGLRAGYACVYFWYTDAVPSGIQAKVVNYGTEEPNCRNTVDPRPLPGKVLEVRPMVNPAFEDTTDYPNVARWDWDSVHSVQYFGLACLHPNRKPAWCEVGPPGFVSSTLPRIQSPATTPASYPPNWRRVYSIKGWFDEQRLDLPKEDPDDMSLPRLGPVRGYIFPEPRLDHSAKNRFKNNWVPVARIALQPPEIYKKKHNYTPTGSASGWDAASWDELNRLELCWGTWWKCLAPKGVYLIGGGPCKDQVPGEIDEDQKRWWARVVAADGTVSYRCTTRRDHKDVNPPARGTSRWRVRLADPGTWEECAHGCCET